MRSLIATLLVCCLAGCASIEGPPFAHEIAIPRSYATGSYARGDESQAAWFIRGHEDGWWSRVEEFVAGTNRRPEPAYPEKKIDDGSGYVAAGYVAGYSIGYSASVDRVALLVRKHGEKEALAVAKQALNQVEERKRANQALQTTPMTRSVFEKTRAFEDQSRGV